MPVDSQHPQYTDRLPDWQDCRLFHQGQKEVLKVADRFLPKPEDATPKEYENYTMRAFFFPAMERTVAGLSGAVDRKAPTIDIPKRIEHIRNNADSENASLRQFGKTVLDELLITGRVGLLPDRDTDGGQSYLTMYRAENIINWGYHKTDGLTFVVLLEIFYEPSTSDPYVQDKKKRWRVLLLENGTYIQKLYKEGPSGQIVEDATFEFANAGNPLNYIPFVFCNVRSITTQIDKPPLLDLVLKNAEHYRVSADYANSLYFTGNPILYVAGVKKPVVQQAATDVPYAMREPEFKITMGSSRAVFLPSKDSRIGMVECSGHGITPNRDRANDIKLEMAVLGARLLENQRTGVEAAETALLRQSGEASTLSNIVNNAGAAMRKALEMLDQWEGGDGKNIEYTLNNDFMDVTMNPQLLSILSDLVTKEYISWDTFYYNLAIGELIVPGRTSNEEKALIELQPPMGSTDNGQVVTNQPE